ncbi:OmpA family protein [Flavobacterium cerinum]|uniref:OmpA family protein n=1 Tax=Flavobacterium cerinum TaxID=2502784 RepID=A0A3S3TVH1_9FLAO|nr:OmpA family protein [Flavobacterium cerinum]RWW92160.1 OmpA family protein [Flavobacterium cerinum]
MKQYLLISFIFIFSSINAQQQYTVYFDFDIDETNSPSTNKLSQWIAENHNVEILKIEGYADSIGNALYNVDLSERRAEYVLEELKENNYIIAKGVEIKAFGEDKAFSKNRAQDRKAIIYYVKPSPPIIPETDFSKAVNTAKKGDKLKLPNMNFYNNSDIMLPESAPILNDLLAILQKNKKLKIDIQGHICCQIKEENEISLRRARAVYNFLIKKGIDAVRLSYKSFGSTKPLHPLPEKNETEKVANRRVEIEILEN